MTPVERIAINKAMTAPDDLVVRIRYTDKAGVTTERLISPIKYLPNDSILALCLCRETPRRFELAKCSHIELVAAHKVLMPAEIVVVSESKTDGIPA